MARAGRQRLALGIAAGAILLAVPGACALFVDLGDRSLLPVEAGGDDASGPTDGASSDGWHDLSDPSNWSWVDVTAFATTADGATLFTSGIQFAGGAFDEDSGLLYLGPAGSDAGSLAGRFDTSAGLDASSAWQFFDMAAASGSVQYSGVVFDGRYVFYVPSSVPQVAWSGHIARYDSIGQFTDRSYWAFFDVPGSKTGFAGGAFDGQLVYFAPFANSPVGGQGVSSPAVAFVHTMPDDAAAYGVHDLFPTTPSVDALYQGVVSDGTYAYFVPNLDGTTTFRSTVVRFRESPDFGDAGAWESFDVTAVNEGAAGFAGGAFDGRYVYFVPYEHHAQTPGSVVARFDTNGTFGDPSAWSTFDTAGVDPRAAGYSLGAFDGRFVYLLPAFNPNILVRYDTTAPFTSKGGWQLADLRSFAPDGAAISIAGAVFDGKYLTLVPHSGPMLRFDARDNRAPPSEKMPPGYAGSFY